ncbi:hydantoinase/oxoprolinase family protein [Rhodobacteraceae bacterium]|nr:hydantoinase/oxoprolinase family protein [Paracoccaceae bacterium]
MPSWVIGIDVGGTFTDFSARELRTGATFLHKRPSTPDNPARAILTGLDELQEKSGIDGDDVVRIAHGTTVATNALLQRKGADVALVTTRGFRDLVEIGRQIRPSIYDLQIDAPPTLVDRINRLEVTERIDANGTAITPLTQAEIAKLVMAVGELDGIESLAICGLFSFLNPKHEQALAKALSVAYPDLFLSVSSEVQPEFREFERFSTTVINAFLQPPVSRYMQHLRTAIAERAPNAAFGIFQSSGGLMAVEKAEKFPVRTALSGPAAGAVGAAAAGNLSGIRDVITLDMGGTSTDVCMIRDGKTTLSHMRDIAGFSIRLPMVDIHTVGAGGGSIARIGPDGLMKVGPESAGAVPGPACYCQGGIEPTVSDANAVLGRLPTTLAGGGLTLDKGRAVQAVRAVADALEISLEAAALGITDIVTSNMTRAIRTVSVEKGHDPRNFTLMPFGGAGGLHAADVARSLGMARIIIPNAPGILCAEGLITADLQEDFVSTCRFELASDLSALQAPLDELVDRALTWRAYEAAGAEDHRLILSMDLRYVGQNYELSVTVHNAPEKPVLPTRQILLDAFFAEHERSYGHYDPDAPVEMVNLRLKATARLSSAQAGLEVPEKESEPVGIQPVWFNANGPIDTPIHDRATLAPGTELHGPVIITQFDATTVVPSGAVIRVDSAMNLIMELDLG